MKRLRSVRGRIQRGIEEKLLNSRSLSNPSIRALLIATVEPHARGPTSSQLHSISKYTLIGDFECDELCTCIVDLLRHAAARREPDYMQVVKLLKVIRYVFAAGNQYFYESFASGDYGWTLKGIRETALHGREGIVENMRAEIEDVLEMCQDRSRWRAHRHQHRAIHHEIHTPATRHSFDGGIPTAVDWRGEQSLFWSSSSRGGPRRIGLGAIEE
jgi:hypothetical protein